MFIYIYQGRTCLKNTAVPTIFWFSAEEQPAGDWVSAYEEVGLACVENSSDIVEGVSSNEGVDSCFAADQSNVMMEDTSELDFAVQDVIQDVIALTAKVCGNDRQATDHSYASLGDHQYMSPRTLKRKAFAAQQQLGAARKKLRFKAQQTRRLKATVSSLKSTLTVLQKKLLISTDCASLLGSLEDVPREIFRR